ncbi:MAG: ferrochelatase [Bacteroidota bacterium]|jgi:ferrochelatase
MNSDRIAVVLFQLGGPDSLGAIEPFLFNLFMDPDIIDFPFARFVRRPLAKFISSNRSKKVAVNYAAIGGKSPILDLTRAQASALETELNKRFPAAVFVAMRYWNPLTSVVAEEIHTGRFKEIILLPLYPQYSITTSGSSINEWNRQCERIGLRDVSQAIVHRFYENPDYISAIVENIDAALSRFEGVPSNKIHLLFSAHGVPVSIIEKGDPYQKHIEATVRLVLERGGWTSPQTLCYQSKVGPAQWLKPSLNETIDRLGAAGVKNVLVIPVAFLTDHIETLHEINIETRHRAKELGIVQFEMMPALNSHPKLIKALADEVTRLVSILKSK